MKVLICGSREIVPLSEDKEYSLSDRRRHKQELERWHIMKAVSEASLEQKIIVTSVVSGGARGVDTLANRRAVEWEVPFTEYPADWYKYGKGAGFLRNIQMLDNCEAVIAIWDGKSKGTAHTIKEAKKRNLPLHIYYV